MKFKTLYHIGGVFIIGLVIGAGINLANLSHKKTEKKPVNAGKNIVCPTIKIQYDTIDITDDMLGRNRVIPAGVFKPKNGIIKLFYLKTTSTKKHVQNYCKQNNTQSILIRRHELEHARKANLTKNIFMFSPRIRGAIAMQNEMIAPAAEIIAAIDYQYKTGHPFPAYRGFVKDAVVDIINAANAQNMKWPIDFNNPKIATIVMQHSQKRFFDELGRGVYKTTVKNAICGHKTNEAYITNNLCDKNAPMFFRPEFCMWAPMWDFESIHGRTNIWFNADDKIKQDLLNKIDSVLNEFAGQNALFYKNVKIR